MFDSVASISVGLLGSRAETALKNIRKLLWNRNLNYQKTRQGGTRERWNLIQSQVSGTASLLDVGCSSGLLTSLAAAAGFFAIGLDANWEVLSKARKRCKPYISLAFIHFPVTPHSVTLLPVCDVVLCLSVYHQWHAKFGHEGAQKILRTLGTKARQRMFFEPASKKSKYGTQPPAFTDFDERSIFEYNQQMLGGLFGDENVEFLGGTTASRSERLRYLFTIRIQPTSGRLDYDVDEAAQVSPDPSTSRKTVRFGNL